MGFPRSADRQPSGAGSSDPHRVIGPVVRAYSARVFNAFHPVRFGIAVRQSRLQMLADIHPSFYGVFTKELRRRWPIDRRLRGREITPGHWAWHHGDQASHLVRSTLASGTSGTPTDGARL